MIFVVFLLQFILFRSFALTITRACCLMPIYFGIIHSPSRILVARLRALFLSSL